jgi:hypothetical protein
MKFRAYALGAVVAAALTGLVPATAMASGTPAASTAVGSGGGASAGAGSSSSSTANTSNNANADNKNNINVSVVTQLPSDYTWHDKKLYENGHEATLPAGYSYRDGGVVGPDDRFYFAPSGDRQGVVVAPMRCQNGKYDYNGASSNNWIGKVVDSALKACAGVYDAAYNLISTAFGGGDDHGSGYGSC